MPATLYPRPVRKGDADQIQFMLQECTYLHRHLDWQHPLDLINKQPFWVMEDGRERIISALACSLFPPGTAWINLFSILSLSKLEIIWDSLFNNLLADCPPPGLQTLAVLPTQPWFIHFLPKHGFNQSQNIIILQWEDQLPPERQMQANWRIRPIELADLPEILQLDNNSFLPLWQMSKENLDFAFRDSSYATVLLQDNHPVGYMIANSTYLGAHISRLAVLAPYQSAGIGYQLVRDGLTHFLKSGINLVTVNTQDDNMASQALYRRAGFKKTRDRVPVFQYQFHHD